MDADRFDALSRALTAPGSRRRALAGLLLGAFGLLGSRRADDAAAHDLLKKCKKKKGKQKKKCVKKAKKHNAGHTAQLTAPPPSSSTPPDACNPNCIDRECGADGCGGSCGTCATEAPETCGETGTCSAGSCELYAWGTVCVEPVCLNSEKSDLGDRCDGSGNCSVSWGTWDCRPGRCDSATGLCTRACSDDSQCSTVGWCNSGFCQYKQSNGTTCSPSTPQQCTSGFCVGGVCCNSACVADNATGDCAGGTCILTCNSDFGDCDGNMTNGCETNLLIDPSHCGACNQPCSGRCGPDNTGILECQSGNCVCTF